MSGETQLSNRNEGNSLAKFFHFPLFYVSARESSVGERSSEIHNSRWRETAATLLSGSIAEASRTKDVTRREREREKESIVCTLRFSSSESTIERRTERACHANYERRRWRKRPREEESRATEERVSREREREMGMKGDLENSGTPKSAREREREERNGWKRRKEGEGERWTARRWSEGEREGGRIKKKGGPGRKRKKKRSSCSRLSGSHI